MKLRTHADAQRLIKLGNALTQFLMNTMKEYSHAADHMPVKTVRDGEGHVVFTYHVDSDEIQARRYYLAGEYAARRRDLEYVQEQLAHLGYVYREHKWCRPEKQ